MFENTHLKSQTRLKVVAALALFVTIVPVREAHAADSGMADLVVSAAVVGYVAASGVVAAGGITTGIGSSVSAHRGVYLPSWVVPSFVHAGLGVGLAAIAVPLGLSFSQSQDPELRAMLLTAGAIHGAIGIWNLVAGIQGLRLKGSTKTGPSMTPVALGDWCRKDDKQWFGVGVQVSSW